jgi:hypothetical protein
LPAGDIETSDRVSPALERRWSSIDETSRRSDEGGGELHCRDVIVANARELKINRSR